jgi:hypothetical protein
MRRAMAVLCGLSVLAGCVDLTGLGNFGSGSGSPAGIRVTVSSQTSGAVSDSAGYTLLERWYDVGVSPIDSGGGSYHLPINGQVSFTVPDRADSLALALDSLPAGCAAPGNPRKQGLIYVPDGRLYVRFDVTCTVQ